jgi:uncharacterized metal-binding protein YceD (DUF177 family)
MDDPPAPQTLLRVAQLPQRKPHDFDLMPDEEMRRDIARMLDLTDLRKLRFTGRIKADGASDWSLGARLGATVVQPCVVTLAPVSTRIDTTVNRHFVKDWTEPAEAEEVEMPDDVSTERLEDTIDLAQIMTEALALALPDYPRSSGATLEQSNFAAEGVTPLRDEDTKPFAGLAALKKKLEDPDG